jgi:hypothetical protein
MLKSDSSENTSLNNSLSTSTSSTSSSLGKSKSPRKIDIDQHRSNVLLFILGYLYDKNCNFSIFPRELIDVILCIFLPTIEFQKIVNCSYYQIDNIEGKNCVKSGPAVGGWMSTNLLRNYSGIVTFTFEQKGGNARNFWSCIGISKDQLWTGPGYDYDRNRQFSFYYRLDVGAVNGKMDTFPHVSNTKSSITTLTIKLSPKKLRILECDKFPMAEKHQHLEFEIPEEYYLMADIYYVDTICSIKEDWNWIPGRESVTFLPPPKIEPNSDSMSTLAIMFEDETHENIEQALIQSNNNLELAVDFLLRERDNF